MLFTTLVVVHGSFAADRQSTHVQTCGIEFDLPAGYRITKPKRSAPSESLSSCEVQIKSSKPPRSLPMECKSKEEDGRPPYNVCDWTIETTGTTPAIQVFRAQLSDKPTLGPFSANDNHEWVLPNAYRNPDPVNALSCGPHPGWSGDWITRGQWIRTKVKNDPGHYAGAFDDPFALVQLAPDIAVVLNPQIFELHQDWQAFCATLRLSPHKRDLP